MGLRSVLFGLVSEDFVGLQFQIFMKLGVLLFEFIDGIFEHETLVLEDSLVLIKVGAQCFILLLEMI